MILVPPVLFDRPQLSLADIEEGERLIDEYRREPEPDENENDEQL